MKMTFRAPIYIVLIALGIIGVSYGYRAGPGASINRSAIIQGDVTFGANAIVSSTAEIVAEGGPIKIGDNVIIQEMVTITNKNPGQTLYIGNGNIFETGSTCEAFRVGSGNIISSNSFVGSGVHITNGCIIKPGCHFTKPGKLRQGAIVTGPDCLAK